MDNPTAFPCTYFDKAIFEANRADFGTIDAKKMAQVTSSGMTLRDYFAGQTLVGLLSQGVGPEGSTDLARRCYAHADAMLTERAKQK